MGIVPGACARTDVAHHGTPHNTLWLEGKKCKACRLPLCAQEAKGWPLIRHHLLDMPLGQHTNWKQRVFCLQPPSS